MASVTHSHTFTWRHGGSDVSVTGDFIEWKEGVPMAPLPAAAAAADGAAPVFGACVGLFPFLFSFLLSFFL